MDMKQQVVAIHGGTTFDTYEDYIAFLKTREVSRDRLLGRDDWKDSLARELGQDHEVLLPLMPNGTNAKYFEWRLWWERLMPLWQSELILIGHSLGGIFLAKYLTENDFSLKVRATILVAAPFDEADVVESLADFTLPSSLDKLVVQGGNIFLFHSQDDPVVPFAQVEKYQQALSKARPVIFSDRGHFNQGRLPELVRLIKSF